MAGNNAAITMLENFMVGNWCFGVCNKYSFYFGNRKGERECANSTRLSLNSRSAMFQRIVLQCGGWIACFAGTLYVFEYLGDFRYRYVPFTLAS